MIADHYLVKKRFGPMIAEHKQPWIIRLARTHSWQWLLMNLYVSCRVNKICFCNYSNVVHTEYLFISIFIFHSGIPAKSSNYYYWGTIQGNCVSTHRDEKSCKVAVESNFWKHVLPVKVSSSICSHSLFNKKRWTEDYYIIICLAHGNDRNATLIITYCRQVFLLH